MDGQPVLRQTLDDHALGDSASFAHVEVRRITMAPSVAAGPHTHNGPVFGVIEAGSAHLQVSGGETRLLRAGDVFFEPGEQLIDRFDATEEGVTFLGWFPVPAGVQPEIRMGG